MTLETLLRRLDINIRKEETHWIKYSILQEDEREEKEEEVLTKLEDFTMYLQKSQKTKNQVI